MSHIKRVIAHRENEFELTEYLVKFVHMKEPVWIYEDNLSDAVGWGNFDKLIKELFEENGLDSSVS